MSLHVRRDLKVFEVGTYWSVFSSFYNGLSVFGEIRPDE